MSAWQRFSQSSLGRQRGFSLVETLVAVSITVMVLAGLGKYMLASSKNIRRFELLTEATYNARSAIDAMVRDLRLAGACLPISGDFMALDGVEGGVGGNDQITTRTGLVRPDLSCVRTTTTLNAQNTNSLKVLNASGFTVGMRGYLRGVTTGEPFTIASVNTSTNTLGLAGNTSNTSYPPTSGVYAIDERTYYLQNRTTDGSNGVSVPQLMLNSGSTGTQVAAQAFATGIESLNFRYVIERNCPACIVETAPVPTNDDWRLVKAIIIDVTARSDRKDSGGNYARRQMTVTVKPRNLLPAQ